MQYYLIGGGDIKAGKLKAIDKDAISKSKNKKVLIIDLTSNDLDKIKKYHEFLDQYFMSVCAEEVQFISKLKSTEDVRQALNLAGVVYLPGGNTKLLLENIKERNVAPILKKLDTTIVGNSAGALVLCKEVILTKDKEIEETQVFPGLGMIDFSVDVHYDNSHDKELFELSKSREIYAIPENCAIVFDDKLSHIGPVYKFSEGKKEKIIN